ncbi:osteoclast-stimulating factor [Capsaspora owczarzaki ATCC 30864]|nr:osteoclast-stimulating factor [Capsaspora owczarzaki ATCC 30864]KJE91251.1 osteoclast-stimulating factor, variant 1 [Capsaspora owczarzaki ATCC 30864]KJE91252.1 osteoclast-stimulating factor, variant 2 [Capsaspora owczarzaki ATCC 30864]|eukprot:XP_004349164.1 osteoclast-stimulating factor [Capsaspora owczarzaki ATCC 30864]
MSAPPAVPKVTAPKPGKVEVFKAVFDYKAQRPDELTFEEGDVLYILEKFNNGWWKARTGKNVGLIPSNYVEANNIVEMDNPIHEAAKRGNVAFLEELIAANISVNGLDKSGSTPLHWAASGGHTECVQMLIAVPNCVLDLQNKLGDTPLHNASWKGHADVVKLLLDAGADPNLINNENQTAYSLAKNADVGALLYSLDPSGDVNTGDADSD